MHSGNMYYKFKRGQIFRLICTIMSGEKDFGRKSVFFFGGHLNTAIALIRAIWRMKALVNECLCPGECMCVYVSPVNYYEPIFKLRAKTLWF